MRAMANLPLFLLLAQLSTPALKDVPACDTGADCVELGRKFAAGQERPQSWPMAQELFRRGCERGEGEGCIYQRLFTERGLAGDAKGRDDRLRAGCEQNKAADCTDLGKLLELRKDLKNSRQLYERGCDLGDASGCELAGTGILMKRYGETDAPKGDAFFAKACELGEAFGCVYHGLDVAQANGVKANPKQANELYKKACEQGAMTGCYNLGFSLANGFASPVNAGEARRLFRKACDGGYGIACVALGNLLAPGSGNEDDDVDANRFFKRGCNAAAGVGCTALARDLAAGIGAEHDEKAAAALYDRACSLGDGGGCARLGEAADQGAGAPRDPARAEASYQRGCETLGSGFACEKLAGKLESDKVRSAALLAKACELKSASACTRTGDLEKGCGYGDVLACKEMIKKLGDSDQLKVNTLLLRACMLKDGDSCYQLGVNYTAGHEGYIHQLQGNVLFEMACNLNHAAACAEVAGIHVLRQGVAYDPVKAWHLYQQSCDLGDVHGCRLLHDFTDNLSQLGKESCGVDRNGNGCNTLGLAYVYGIGQPHDLERAREAFEKSCNMGDHRGCANLGMISTGEMGGRADWAKAHEANEKECESGDAWSCSELAYFYETGRGVKADRAKADAYYKSANEEFNRRCQANDADACEALATNQEHGRGGPPNKVLAKALREKACGIHPCAE
jgi:TPR repeat protein